MRVMLAPSQMQIVSHFLGLFEPRDAILHHFFALIVLYIICNFDGIAMNFSLKVFI